MRTRPSYLLFGVVCASAVLAGSCGENTPTGACRIGVGGCVDSTLGECRTLNGNFKDGVSCSGRPVSTTSPSSSLVAPSAVPKP